MLEDWVGASTFFLWLVIAYRPASLVVRYICWPYGAMAMASYLSFSFPSHPIFFFFFWGGGGGAMPVFSRLLYSVATQFISCQSPVGMWTSLFPLITDAHRPMFSISTGARSRQVKSSHLRMYVSPVSGKIKVISRLREVMLNTKTSEVVNSDVILRC